MPSQAKAPTPIVAESAHAGSARPNPAHAESDPLLADLVARWRAARRALDLPATASFAVIARRLDVDRGTAQRLNRIGKLAGVGRADLPQFPGTRAWHRVVARVERALGGDHPAARDLAGAAERFAEYLARSGGSRSASVRRLSSVTPPQAPPADARPSARERWAEAAADLIGYQADVRLDAQIVRDRPGTPDAPVRQVQMALVTMLRHCRGRAGAMPLAFPRYSFTPPRAGSPLGPTPLGPTPAAAPGGHPFHLLAARTSTPAPDVLTTADAAGQTIFVEPQWVTRPDPLDVALLLGDPTPFPSPWGQELEWLEFACINRHPCRQLVLERFVSAEKDAVVSPSLQAFRSHVKLSHDEPWFDRLPQEAAAVRRVGSVADAMADEPFPGYAAVLAEALDHLAWSDADDLVVYRATIVHPIPLATYNLMFDRTRPGPA